MVTPVTEYISNQSLRNDVTKHHRRKTGPQQQYKQPMLSSHVVGWEAGLVQPIGETRYRHRTSDLSQFSAASDRAMRGQSAQATMSTLGKAAVSSSAGFGMGF